MQQRQRINLVEKWMVMLLQFSVNCIDILLNILSSIPILGYAGSALSIVWSMFWNPLIMLYLYMKGRHSHKLRWRIAISLFLWGIQIFTPIAPFIGNWIDILLMLFNTVFLYFTLRSIEKEDNEYNKNMSQQADQAKAVMEAKGKKQEEERAQWDGMQKNNE